MPWIFAVVTVTSRRASRSQSVPQLAGVHAGSGVMHPADVRAGVQQLLRHVETVEDQREGVPADVIWQRVDASRELVLRDAVRIQLLVAGEDKTGSLGLQSGDVHYREPANRDDGAWCHC